MDGEIIPYIRPARKYFWPDFSLFGYVRALLRPFPSKCAMGRREADTAYA